KLIITRRTPIHCSLHSKTLTQEENFEFIYSCPCKIDHRLSFKEHESITNEGKVMRCKKCQELLFFIRSQEKTYKG
ncbi:TPA: hypothetical protein R4K32_001438, partial [Campylobacter coli]|nr:hypothetical protein [Campylobacter coli]